MVEVISDEAELMGLELDKNDKVPALKNLPTEVNETTKHNLKDFAWSYQYLGKIYSFRTMLKESLQALQAAENIYNLIYKNDQVIQMLEIHKSRKEAYLRAFSSRNKENLVEAQACLDKIKTLL